MFEYNQGNPMAGTTQSKPTKSAVVEQAKNLPITLPPGYNPQPVFTYGLANPLEQRVTKPGQTLPTTTAPVSTPKPTITPAAAPSPSVVPSPVKVEGPIVTGGTQGQNPAAGTFSGWEYSADGKQRRMKFNDGAGGFYYGSFESVSSDNMQQAVQTPTRTLALDTFKATLGLIFGKAEADKSYVSKLYDLTSSFYKTGSSIDESINLALYQAEQEGAIPEFTSRFKGIFALRDLKQKGMAVIVPTVADFIAAEAKMGEVLTNAGLGDLATEEFLGGVIGRGKSVLEVGNLISDVFNVIDYAPTELKKTLQTYFPAVDRTSLAKALLTGTQGAQELSQKVKGVSVLSAAQQQGVTGVDLTAATDIARQGYDYQQALTGFGEVKRLERANFLAELKGQGFNVSQAQQAVFGKDIAQQQTLEKIREEEVGRFRGSSGRLASRDRAAGLI